MIRPVGDETGSEEVAGDDYIIDIELVKTPVWVMILLATGYILKNFKKESGERVNQRIKLEIMKSRIMVMIDKIFFILINIFGGRFF